MDRWIDGYFKIKNRFLFAQTSGSNLLVSKRLGSNFKLLEQVVDSLHGSLVTRLWLQPFPTRMSVRVVMLMFAYGWSKFTFHSRFELCACANRVQQISTSSATAIVNLEDQKPTTYRMHPGSSNLRYLHGVPKTESVVKRDGLGFCHVCAYFAILTRIANPTVVDVAR